MPPKFKTLLQGRIHHQGNHHQHSSTILYLFWILLDPHCTYWISLDPIGLESKPSACACPTCRLALHWMAPRHRSHRRPPLHRSKFRGPAQRSMDDPQIWDDFDVFLNLCLNTSIWQCVKTNSTPVVHIKIAGIYGCSLP